MKQSDDSMIKSDPYETQKQKANRLETPEDVYYNIIDMIKRVGVVPPTLDVFASLKNSRCIDCITEEDDAFIKEFLLPDGSIPDTIWANVPHDIYRLGLPRIHDQYLKYDFNAVILIPTVNVRTRYWHEIVEPNRIDINPNGYSFYFPLDSAVYFTLDNEPLRDSKGRKSHSHNAYNVLLFIRKKNIKSFKDRLKFLYSSSLYYNSLDY